MSTLERAISIAAEAHAGARDKGGAFLHPLRVPDQAQRYSITFRTMAAKS